MPDSWLLAARGAWLDRILECRQPAKAAALRCTPWFIRPESPDLPWVPPPPPPLQRMRGVPLVGVPVAWETDKPLQR